MSRARKIDGVWVTACVRGRQASSGRMNRKPQRVAGARVAIVAVGVEDEYCWVLFVVPASSPQGAGRDRLSQRRSTLPYLIAGLN